MKKLLITLICHNLLIMPAFCMISDSLAEEKLDSSRPYPKPRTVNITDSFAEDSLKNCNPTRIKIRLITDEFAESNTAKNVPLLEPVDLHEYLPTHTSQDYNKYKKNCQKAIDLENSNLAKIKIRIRNPLTTKNKTVDEGDYIEFETVEAVYINNRNYPKGTIVKARVENISQNRSKGVPADIVIGNFTIDNHKLNGEITKTGANRSLWVYPASYIGSGFFGLGALLLFIRGGHAKITPFENFTIYSNK